ncbi:hypothetical protein KM043_016985 [Ampulex compressa]|nr:hypothetical protein KM043_016985 [Ampulex compressa]
MSTGSLPVRAPRSFQRPNDNESSWQRRNRMAKLRMLYTNICSFRYPSRVAGTLRGFSFDIMKATSTAMVETKKSCNEVMTAWCRHLPFLLSLKSMVYFVVSLMMQRKLPGVLWSIPQHHCCFLNQY